MAYSRGSSSNIIVGAAALFTHNAGPIGLDEDGKITDAQAAVDLLWIYVYTDAYCEKQRDVNEIIANSGE